MTRTRKVCIYLECDKPISIPGRPNGIQDTCNCLHVLRRVYHMSVSGKVSQQQEQLTFRWSLSFPFNNCPKAATKSFISCSSPSSSSSFAGDVEGRFDVGPVGTLLVGDRTLLRSFEIGNERDVLSSAAASELSLPVCSKPCWSIRKNRSYKRSLRKTRRP